MGAVYFYHLTRSPLETTLAMLVEKSRQAGWRVLVRGTLPERMTWLNDALWQRAPDSFLPHGLAGGEFDVQQPVLLTSAPGNANAAQCVMSVDGGEIEIAEVSGLERACVIFDGNDAASLDRAREQWKTLTAGGCTAQYWSQQDGKWALKVQSD